MPEVFEFARARVELFLDSGTLEGQVSTATSDIQVFSQNVANSLTAARGEAGDTGVAFDRFGQSVNTVFTALGVQASILQRLPGLFLKFGKAAPWVALVLGIKSAVSASDEFDHTLLRITSTFDLTEKQTESLRNTLLTFPGAFGGIEGAARAAFIALQQGIPQEQLDAFLKTSARYALVTGKDVAGATQSITRILQAYDLEAGKATEITDTLFSVMRKGGGDIESIGGAIANLGPLATELGINFDEVGFVLGKATTRGVNLTRASIGLQRVLSLINRDTETFGKLGIDIKERARKEGLIGVFEAIQEAVGKAKGGIKDIGIDARTSGLILAILKDGVSELREELEKLRKERATGAGIVDEKAAAELDTVSAKTKQAAGAFKAGSIATGKFIDTFGGLVPGGVITAATKNILDSTTDISRAFAKLGNTGEVFTVEGEQMVTEARKLAKKVQAAASAVTDLPPVNVTELLDKIFPSAVLEREEKKRLAKFAPLVKSLAVASGDALESQVARGIHGANLILLSFNKEFLEFLQKSGSDLPALNKLVIEGEKAVTAERIRLYTQVFDLRKSFNVATVQDEKALSKQLLSLTKVGTEERLNILKQSVEREKAIRDESRAAANKTIELLKQAPQIGTTGLRDVSGFFNKTASDAIQAKKSLESELESIQQHGVVNLEKLEDSFKKVLAQQDIEEFIQRFGGVGTGLREIFAGAFTKIDTSPLKEVERSLNDVERQATRTADAISKITNPRGILPGQTFPSSEQGLAGAMTNANLRVYGEQL